MFNNFILKIKKIIENRNKNSLTILILALFILFLIGASFAYFTAQVKSGANANINVATGTTDSLMFKSVQDIDLLVEVKDFSIGGGDLAREAISSANLRANNATNQASASYNAFLLIDSNDFVYTTESYEPELIVKIYDPKGNEVTDIEGLKRTEDGFDITTRTGGFLIRSDYDIETLGTDTTIQEWKAEVTLVNLNTDQRGNMGKHFSARLYLTQEKLSTYELPLVNSININDEEKTSSSMIARMNVTNGTENIEKYFFAIEEVESDIAFNNFNYGLKRLANTDKELDWKETNQPYYEFKELTSNTAYKIYGYAMDKNGIKSNEYITEEPITTNRYIYPKIIDVTYTNTLESITVYVNATKGENEIAKYFYSINDGEYIESTKSTYTFNDLKDTTSYKIKIKVNDIKGEFSTEFVKPNAETEKYILPNITKVEKVTTYNSATLTITATNGHGEVHGNYPITEYWYQINDGDWKEASSNVIVLDNLEEETDYSVNIKVKDAYGKESEVYPVSLTTDVYEIPTVTATVPTNTITSNSFTINATATNGDGTITKYMYSKDGGSNWVTVNSSSLTDSYTFDNLTSGATFQVKVKVVDSNNRESEVVSIPDITTLNVFTNNSSNYIGGYNEKAQSFTLSVSPSPTSIYYSTSTKLTIINYKTSGSPNKPTRTDLGETTVYWCAEKSGYETICGENTITINKGTPIFNLSATSSTISSTANTSSITVTRSGDGQVSCVSASTGTTTGTYAKCSVSGTIVTFTRVAAGTENFTIKLASGTNYNAGSDKTVTLTVSKLNFTNNSSNVTGTYNGSSKTFTPSLSPSATSIYYSTSTELTTSNYTSSGSTSGTHSRTNAGTTTVYWCAVKAGYNTLCSKNTITVNKATPTFTVASSSATIGSSATTAIVSYTYNGDGVVSCSPSSGTYASCSVNTSSKVITFTRKSWNSSGTQSFTISATSGTNYNAGTNKTISLKVEAEALAHYIKGLYTSQGSNGLYYHTSSLANSAGDNSYRYAGADPSNYVCFGTNASTCPVDNLYRIIGVFGENVKLIKYDYVTSALLGTDGNYYGTNTPAGTYKGSQTTMTMYSWDPSRVSNNWNDSKLNTINLNTNYLNNIGSTWAEKIEETNWNIGGYSTYEVSAKSFYDAEKTSTSKAKIGLMSVSDYGFATLPNNWTTNMNNSGITNNNWIYMGYGEWTITKLSITSIDSFAVRDPGDVCNYYLHYGGGIRPSFSLKSTVTYVGGTGTKTDPYRIN